MGPAPGGGRAGAPGARAGAPPVRRGQREGVPERSSTERAGIAPRVVNVILGAWLFASVLLWRHWGPEGFDTLITGLLVITVAACAVWTPRLRFGGTFLAAWLLFMTLVLVHARRLTFFHDLAVALAIVVLSAAPSRPWEYQRRHAEA